MPKIFQKLNSFGVPTYPTLASFLLPIFVLFFIHDILGLASLYAIGFVGAIAVNLFATSTNKSIKLANWKRVFMFGTFIIMFLIEITLFIDKPHARTFVLSILGAGILIREFVQESKEKEEKEIPEFSSLPTIPEDKFDASLVALSGINKSLECAIEDCVEKNIPLYILFIRELKFVAKTDQKFSWENDEEASKVFNHILALKLTIPVEFLYNVTSTTAHSIVEIAKLKNVKRVFVGRKRGIPLLNFIRGSTINDLAKIIPKEMDLLVIY